MTVSFIHGVSVRKNEQYWDHSEIRDRLFRHVLLPRIGIDLSTGLHNIYWGDLGSKLPDDLFIPGDGLEELSGGADDPLAAWVATAMMPGPDIGMAADGSGAVRVSDAVDLVWLVAQAFATEDERAVIEPLLDEAANAVVQDQNRGFGITTIETVADSIIRSTCPDAGLANADELEELGGMINPRDLIVAMLDQAVAIANRGSGGWISRAYRENIVRMTGGLIGDTVAYVRQRRNEDGSAGPIPSRIIAGLRTARSFGSPHIVIAHSMGGNIMADVAMNFAPDLDIDVLVTVGSQVTLFDHVGLFGANSALGRRPVPSSIRSWINIYDPADPLGLPFGRYMPDVRDVVFNTTKGIFLSHSSYFQSRTFHELLAQEVGSAIESQKAP